MNAWIRIDRGIYRLFNIEAHPDKNQIIFRYLLEMDRYACGYVEIDFQRIDATMEYIVACIETGKVIDLRSGSS